MGTGRFIRLLNPSTSTTTSSLVVTGNNNTDETYKTTLNDLSMSFRNLTDITCFNSLICEGELSSDTLSVTRQSPSHGVTFNVDDTSIITTPFQPHAEIVRTSYSPPLIPYQWNRLTFNTVNIDRHNNMDPTWIFHAPVPGAYLVNASIRLNPIPSGRLEMSITASTGGETYGRAEYINTTLVFVPITAIAYSPAAPFTICVKVRHRDDTNEIKFLHGSCSFTLIG